MARNQGEKVKGVADIVFLIDITGSMAGCIEALQNNIAKFIDFLTSTGANDAVIKDWRGKCVGFRDYEHDVSNWIEDNPFVRDADRLKEQLYKFNADGGGDEPETLLDAIYTIGSMGETTQGATESPDKWRHKRDAARVIVIFSDASFKPKMFISPATGGSVNDIITLIHDKRLILSIFAPDLSCYDRLATADKSEFQSVAGLGLAEITSDTKNFQQTLKQLAASVSKSAATPEL